MNIENAVKLLTSNIEEDVLIGYTLLRKDYTPDQINRLIHPARMYTTEMDDVGGLYIRIFKYNWITDWVKIESYENRENSAIIKE